MTLEAVTSSGTRPAERWRRTVVNAAGRVFEVPGNAAAPLLVAVVEGEADALARLRLPGVLVRAAGGTGGMAGAALVADLRTLELKRGAAPVRALGRRQSRKIGQACTRG